MELRKTTLSDLEQLFVFQSDPKGVWMAAFTPENPSDKEFYLKKYSELVANPAIHMLTLWVNDRIVGSVAHFEMMGETNITYGIDSTQWGKGYATEGLQKFLLTTPTRPLHARTAFDNLASQRVLEKCGFKKIGREFGYANARQTEIEEFVFRLT